MHSVSDKKIELCFFLKRSEPCYHLNDTEYTVSQISMGIVYIYTNLLYRTVVILCVHGKCTEDIKSQWKILSYAYV